MFDVERSTFDVRRACGVGKSQGLKVKGRRERAAATALPLLYDLQTFRPSTFRPSDAAGSSSSSDLPTPQTLPLRSLAANRTRKSILDVNARGPLSPHSRKK